MLTHHMQEFNNVTDYERSRKVDLLIEFLLRHFENEVEEYKTFKEVANENQDEQLDGQLYSTLVLDVDMISASLNAVIKNVHDLDMNKLDYHSLLSNPELINLQHTVAGLESKLAEIDFQLKKIVPPEKEQETKTDDK